MAKTKTSVIDLSRKLCSCPRCNERDCKRHSVSRRRLKEISMGEESAVLEVIYSKHYCPECNKHFSLPMPHLARSSGRYTNRVRSAAIKLVFEGSTLSGASKYMNSKFKVHVPPNTIFDWVVTEQSGG